MQYIIFFAIISAVFSKNGHYSLLPIQCAFFVIALTKSRFAGNNGNIINKVKPLNIVIGILYIFLGSAISAVTSAVFFHYANISNFFDGIIFCVTILEIQLIFFAIIALMLILKKNHVAVKNVTLICTLFPCVSLFLKEITSVSKSLLFILLFIASVLIYFSILLSKTKNGVEKE